MMSARNPHAAHRFDLDDTQLAHSVAVGTFIGLPLVFAVSTLSALSVGLANAMAIAVLPTLFSGSFVGGLILLMTALRRAERRATATPLPASCPCTTTVIPGTTMVAGGMQAGDTQAVA